MKTRLYIRPQIQTLRQQYSTVRSFKFSPLTEEVFATSGSQFFDFLSAVSKRRDQSASLGL
jgi:hypothetical protein